ncbi:MAG: methyltransferase domain-containing protein, partial [bacterium]
FDLQRKFDVIEMGFVLEHVDDPSLIIKRFAQMLHADGLLFAAVPNACSLHRLIGYHAGILESTHELSPADLALGHKHYFDKESFCNLITQIGLKIKKIEGIYLKPFSTSQLQTLNLSPEVQQALLTIGSTFPDICNSIYIEAGL